MGANDTELFKEMTHFENLSFLDSFSWTVFIKIFFLIVDAGGEQSRFCREFLYESQIMTHLGFLQMTHQSPCYTFQCSFGNIDSPLSREKVVMILATESTLLVGIKSDS